jgi:hypothetical protein
VHVIEQAIELAGVVLVAIAGRAAFLYIRPWRTCRWCRPGGVIFGSVVARMLGHELKGRRRRGCWRCRGRRRTRRWGAFHVHKVHLSLRQAWNERGTG